LKDLNLNGHCSCGDVNFTVKGKPLLRAFCHCTICQAYNEAPYADITLFRSSDVIMPQEGSVAFNSSVFPPIVHRGKCVSCGKAAIEYLRLFPMPKIIIVPSNNIDDKAFIPDASFHIFYDKRISDIEDNLPKYNGYLKSEFAFGHQLIASLLRKSKSI
jgi:hypothetical protein